MIIDYPEIDTTDMVALQQLEDARNFLAYATMHLVSVIGNAD